LAYLLIEVVGPCQVIDGGVNSPPQILKNHGKFLFRTKVSKKTKVAIDVVIFDFSKEEGWCWPSKDQRGDAEEPIGEPIALTAPKPPQKKKLIRLVEISAIFLSYFNFYHSAILSQCLLVFPRSARSLMASRARLAARRSL
jgi:hypothetical protein